MSFWRHEEIYRSDVGLGKAGNGNGRRRSPRSSAAMSFPSAIPRQVALQQSLPPLYRRETILNNQCCRTMILQRTATTPLTPCLSPRVHSKELPPSPPPHPQNRDQKTVNYVPGLKCQLTNCPAGHSTAASRLCRTDSFNRKPAPPNTRRSDTSAFARNRFPPSRCAVRAGQSLWKHSKGGLPAACWCNAACMPRPETLQR